MRITYTNDKAEPGWAQLRCAEEPFPEAPLRLSLQRAKDHRFLNSDGKWYTRPMYLDVAQVRAGADLVLLLPPAIVSQLDTCAHRVGLLAPDDTLFKGQVMIANPQIRATRKTLLRRMRPWNSGWRHASVRKPERMRGRGSRPGGRRRTLAAHRFRLAEAGALSGRSRERQCRLSGIPGCACCWQPKTRIPG